MKSSVVPLSLFVSSMLFAASLTAAGIDMNEAHRAVGRQDDVRVDAQLLTDVITAGAPIGVTYQIHNLTDSSVAVAEKVCSASFDAESQTITVSVGSEIPVDGEMPRMAVIGPGEKKTFTTAATVRRIATAVRAARPVVRYLQIKVSVLRDLVPFRALLERQQMQAQAEAMPLNDAQFEKWLEGNDTIFLNTLPIRFESRGGSGSDASQRAPAASGIR
jgi:hypothetical protein